ncbi:MULTISPECIES: hypothetical protein [unclassified Guyparkeria]|uniref:hypothetical protein n=1 Tax=unclassified Guyparkeria TaxID=2626246 RepID=UPI0012E389AD|nr:MULTISPECIES: hypothetical protein [unclassified Guyparkeria]
MRLFWALLIELIVLASAYAALVLAGVDPFVSAFGLLIVGAPLLHLLVGRLLKLRVGARGGDR